MIKFIHKKHMQKENGSKFVIYYNVSDIVLGVMLLSLVAFFIHNYISTSLNSENNCGIYPVTQTYNSRMMNSGRVQ
jgi:hypothetical protein